MLTARSIAFAACVAALVHAQAPVPKRVAAWSEDLRFFADNFASRQMDFAKVYPQAEFDAALKDIGARVPDLSDSEIVLRLMRLVASAGVAHNTLRFPGPMGFNQGLPLDFQWFPDAVVVTGATNDYEAAIGSRVIRIGKMTPGELLDQLTSYIPHENESWLREMAPAYLRLEAMVRHFGLVDDNGKVALTLEKSGQKAFTQTVALGPYGVKMTGLYQSLKTPEVLYRSRPGEPYWHKYLDDSQTLFIQYNVCQSNPRHPFDAFVREALAEADAHPVKRVVIDLRWNGGGNSTIMTPLLDGLAARRGKLGPVYGLIGAHTFSSALLNAIQLRNDLHARLIGEPTGGKPNEYGEVRAFTLPNSGFAVQYTTKFFRFKGEENATTLAPAIKAPITFADVLTGRDPALEAAIGN